MNDTVRASRAKEFTKPHAHRSVAPQVTGTFGSSTGSLWPWAARQVDRPNCLEHPAHRLHLLRVLADGGNECVLHCLVGHHGQTCAERPTTRATCPSRARALRLLCQIQGRPDAAPPAGRSTSFLRPHFGRPFSGGADRHLAANPVGAEHREQGALGKICRPGRDLSLVRSGRRDGRIIQCGCLSQKTTEENEV